MINIAVVEDEKICASHIIELINRYATEHNVAFITRHFSNAIEFLECNKTFDIVFMDIELPDMDGMKASERFREMDEQAIIVFVTNMANYAVKGYKVGALDFVVKPLVYEHLDIVLNRAERIVRERRAEPEIKISLINGFVRLRASEIYYVEISDHTLIYHTERGEVTATGKLNALEKLLAPAGFARCNNCYLVNMKYVKSVSGYSVTVGGDELQISHPKRKRFMSALSLYIGEHGNA